YPCIPAISRSGAALNCRSISRADDVSATSAGVAFEVARLLVPVREHVTIAHPAVDPMCMARRAMGVAMNHPGHAMLPKGRDDGTVVRVHDLHRFFRLRRVAGFAQSPRPLDALGEGQGEKCILPLG